MWLTPHIGKIMPASETLKHRDSSPHVEYHPLLDAEAPPSSGESWKYTKWLLVVGGVVMVTAAVSVVMVIKPPHTSPPTVAAQGQKVPAQEGVCQDSVANKNVQDGDLSIRDKLLAELQAENIRNNLRHLTEKPHLAGTPADFDQAEELRQFWVDVGLDVAKVVPYKVQISYPDLNDPCRIELQDGRGQALFTTQLVEKIVRPEQNHSDVVPPFNAYSARGTPRGDLVYVNYGRVQDFTWLKENTNIDLTNKILIARYGKIFRGSKAKLAEQHGAAGLILYSDPADYAVNNVHDAYPNSWWLPDTGVQRGSVNIAGDPLTPGYPAIESAFRAFEEDKFWLPKIPIHPISYGDAKRLLEDMSGEVVPDGWAGEIPGITYRLGPGHNQNWKVQMFISTTLKNVTTYNAIGYIQGGVEPDRYVLVGNHRDAWVFGAVDPSSGTAAMMEMSRGFGEMLKTGWRPRRTIVFCSWGAEEYSLIGSREWVENYQRLLGDRAVAYLNVDIAVQGNYTLRAKGMPMLEDALMDVAKSIPNPQQSEIDKGRYTLYDTWAAHMPEKDPNGQPTGKPKISIPGSGSDFEPFVTVVGVTCLDIRYHYDESTGISSYPLYHSVYETFHLVDTFMDPGFKLHLSVTQYWGEMARHLADSLILPFNVVRYAERIKQYYEALVAHYGSQIQQHSDKGLEYLEQAVEDLGEAATKFNEKLKNIDKRNPLEIRQYNDQMMQLERAFIDPMGLPGRPYTRHVVFAPSVHDSYAGSAFPGLSDSLFEIDKVTGDEATTRWTEVQRQLATITFFVRSAEASLRNVVDY